MTDLNKLRSEFETMPLIKEKLNAVYFDETLNSYFAAMINSSPTVKYVQGAWMAWQEKAKAQVEPEWKSVNNILPDTEPNTDGIACAVVDENGNVHRARYMHDVYEGGESKYWSEFTFSGNGIENEHYEINEKITHWMPLPKASESGAEG